MTTETTTNVEKGLARAAEARAAAGLPPRRRVQGPFAEMLAEAGFSARAVRKRGKNFCANFATGTIGAGVFTEKELAAVAESFKRVSAGLTNGTLAVVDGRLTEVAAA